MKGPARTGPRLGGAVLALAAACSVAVAASPEGPSLLEGGEGRPYLGQAAVAEQTATLPAPPAPGSTADNADRALFAATRRLEGTPRWALARSDADRRPASILGDFACALGMRISPAAAPAVMTLLARTYGDVEKASRGVKALYRRARPLAGNTAVICEPRSQHLETSFSYPSGHATQAWIAALILADLVPDRASALMRRGRLYGESRVICGAHWGSDVAAARLEGETLFKALRAEPTFGADLVAARRETAALRGTAPSPDPETCAREADAAAHPPEP